MPLSALQAQIEARYGLDSTVPIDDFVVTERGFLEALAEDASRVERHPRELLLISEAEGALDVSVFIDAGVLQRLADSDPFDALGDHNLDDFLVALEGVSHFVYLAHNARFDKSVTPFELELQAEIDKFLVVVALVAEQSGHEPLASIHEVLFEAARIGDWVAPEVRERYEAANFYAGKYCRQLIAAGIGATTPDHLSRELCRFYRLPRNAKVRHIESRRTTRH